MARGAAGDNPAESLPGEVAAFIDRHSLLPAGAALLAAVSGGADSTALLHVLHALAGEAERGYRLTVAHLDHGLRASSAEDAAFVTRLAQELNLPLVAGRVDVAEQARARKQSIELAGRQARQEFFRAAARDAGCDYIATGHQADDNVETVLHRIVRGTGLDGLRGIRVSRRLGSAGPWMVRPLLGVSRRRVRAYLTGRGLPWREDPTNRDAAHTRNRIRHELLPLLRERFNPAVEAAIARLIVSAEWAGRWLDDLAAETFATLAIERSDRHVSLAAPPLRRKGELVVSQAIRAALDALGAPRRAVGLDHIRRVMTLLAEGRDGAELHLPHDIRVRREPQKLVFELGPAARPALSAEVHELAIPGQADLPDGSLLCVELRPGGQAEQRALCQGKPATLEVVDAARLAGPLLVRRRRRGDRFQPLGSTGHKSVSDFFTDAKVAAVLRRQAWVVCDRLGPVWLAPHRIDERVKVTAATRELAVLRLEAAG